MAEPSGERLEQIILLVMVCAAIGAFGTAFNLPLVWVLWAPCGVSLFWRIGRVPAWLDSSVRLFAYGFEALAVGLALVFTAYPWLSGESATSLTLLAGVGLSGFATLFLLGTPVWPRATTLFPAAMGLLVVACFNPEARHRPLLAGAGLCVFAYLILPVVGRGARKVSGAQWARMAGALLLAALFAAALIVAVPMLQTKTESLVFEYMQANTTMYSGLSERTSLGDMEELKLSSRVVMRVWTDRPQYLRARTYSRFDGRGWTRRRSASSALPVVETVANGEWRDWLEQIPGRTYGFPALDGPEVAGSAVRTRIIQKLFNNGMMVSPANKLLVRAEVRELRTDPEEDLQTPPADGVEIYGVLNRPDGEATQRVPASEQELVEALQLPADTDPRLRELAERLAEGADSPEEKLERTLNYLQQGYRYSLKVGRFHTTQPVAEFLFEKKQGYCQYFAGAAAVLLRLEGVPTRYVSGFHVDGNNRDGDHYVVRELDAHAWIESYIPGKGWVQADPTPAAEYGSLYAGLSRGWFTRALERGQAAIAELRVRLRGDWRSGVRWAWAQGKQAMHWLFLTTKGLGLWAVALLVWLARYLGRRSKIAPRDRGRSRAVRQAAESAPELAELLERLDEYWSRCGVARPRHRAWLEHLEAIPAGKLSAEGHTTARRLIESYYVASFGGETRGRGEIDSLRHEMECLEARGDPVV